MDKNSIFINSVFKYFNNDNLKKKYFDTEKSFVPDPNHRGSFFLVFKLTVRYFHPFWNNYIFDS